MLKRKQIYRDYYINYLKYDHRQNVQRLTDLCRILYMEIATCSFLDYSEHERKSQNLKLNYWAPNYYIGLYMCVCESFMFYLYSDWPQLFYLS
jgi:hypothetical protein